MIAVAIITAPRPKPTLTESIRSLRADGGYTGRIVIMSEPTLSASHWMARAADDGPHVVCEHKKQQGNLRNWVAALEFVMKADEPWLMVCEDDITWARYSFPALLTELSTIKALPNAGAYSLFLPVRMAKLCERATGQKLKYGWHQSGMQIGNKMWGAQALLFSREQASALLTDPEFKMFLANPKWDKNVDAIIAHCINARQRRIYWRVPCLVNHDLGAGNSSLGYPDRPDLRTQYFIGIA